MNKLFLVVITCFLILRSNLNGQNAWTQKADLPDSARYLAVGYSSNGKGYVGTGNTGAINSYLNSFWQYDPSSNTWLQKVSFLGGGRYGAVAFSIGKDGYIGTGGDSTFGGATKDFWQYDTLTNIWTQKADFGGIERYYAVGFSINDYGYIGTGLEIHTLPYGFSDLWQYDPMNNLWTQKQNVPGPRRHLAVGFSILGKGYIGTGIDSANNYLKDFWEFEPISNTWTQKADYAGQETQGAVGFSIGTKGYVGTGRGISTMYKNDFWEYDPMSNSWSQKANFGGTARQNAVGFSTSGKGYIGTGFDGSYKSDLWEYIPGTSTSIDVNSFDPVEIIVSSHDGTLSFTIQGLKRETGIVDIQIYDVDGNLQGENKVSFSGGACSGVFKTQIRLAGIYFFRISLDEKYIVKKFINK